MEKKEPHTPEKKFLAGAVSATVWNNSGVTADGRETFFTTVSIERRYKDKEGAWKSTGSLRVNDLPRAAMVLNKAYEYIVLTEKYNGEESDEK